MSENIFSALAKYNSACDENYLTEAFVFVLNHLLNEDREHGLGILSLLCINGEDFAFDRDESISISTQEVTQYGTPDIKISSPNKLIYVEVKHDSGLERTQIDRYNKALELSNAEIKHVVLLTRFRPILLKNQQNHTSMYAGMKSTIGCPPSSQAAGLVHI